MRDFHLYWIGIRESELKDTGALFTGSITIFGTGNGNNYAFDKEYHYRYDYNQDSDLLSAFINEKALQILTGDSDARFMLYYPVDIAFLSSRVQERTLYANDLQLTKFLDDKIRTRMWLSEQISMPPFFTVTGQNVKYSDLKSMFPQYNKFVIQADYSCGGSGTWLLTSDNRAEIAKRISATLQYTAMPYFEHSISLNVHIVIYKNDIIIMPASIQLISIKEYALSYQGSDFIAYTYLPESIREKVKNYAKIIGKQLQYSGYLGVCGIDFIATKTDVYFSEINGRFQSSTILLNKAMRNIGLNISMQSLHIDAFENNRCTIKLPDFCVPYSFYGYSYQPEVIDKLKCLLSYAQKAQEVMEIQTDELDWTMHFETNTYLFKLIFQTNIAFAGTEHTTILHSNLDIMHSIFHPDDYKNQLPELKIMLLNHGIRIEQDALDLLNKDGGVNYEEFEAIDMVLEDRIYINVPYTTKMSSLSPFSVKVNDLGCLALFYFNQPITEITIRTKDPLGKCVSKNGIPYEKFIYLGNDRLRIFHRNGCNFKSMNMGCKFCDIETNDRPLPMEDIREAIEAYAGHSNINHFMIGGGSERIDSDFENIILIAGYLKNRFAKPINVMSIPPIDIKILSKLKKAGVTEVTFNLEIFDRDIAKEYMPGKGSLSLDVYDAAFQEAVKLWGNTGNVRTVFIVGLENKSSLLCGIKHVCKLGVYPILSLLKGIEGTPLAHCLPPQDKEILGIYHEARNICQSFHMDLGPSCHYCEDNTLKISYNRL